jgi:hypothetical protein
MTDATPADLLAEFLAEQFELCAELEALADSLPLRMDTYAAMSLLERLHATLHRCQRFEEGEIFPALATRRPDLRPTLDRLRAEHFEDQDQASDLRDAVEGFLTRREPPKAEEIGYMLRGLFTSLRRHLAFDRDVILPLCRLPAVR